MADTFGLIKKASLYDDAFNFQQKTILLHFPTQRAGA